METRNNINFIEDGFLHAHREISSKEKTVTHYISCGDYNRFGQRLPIENYDKREYDKNGMVLFNHGCEGFITLPVKEQLEFLIARNQWTKADGNYLKAKTQFHTNKTLQNYDTSNDIFILYEEGFLNAWSKHWFPSGLNGGVDYDQITFNKDGTIDVDRWGIYEYSSVFVPADSGATTDINRLHNMLEVVKSDKMKNFISDFQVHSATEGETQRIISKLREEFKEELNSTRAEQLSAFNEQIKKNNIAVNKAIEDSFDNYTKNLIENIREIVGGEVLQRFNSLNIENRIEVVCKKELAGAIRNITGRL